VIFLHELLKKERKNQGPLKEQRHSTLNAKKEQKDEKLQY
jgi:hypothetical protein